MSAQLTQARNYDVNNMVFSVPQEGKVPNSPITYSRINISTRYPDGNVGDLILQTPTLFSFGVQENKAMDKKDEINGYSMPLCLYSRNGATDEERIWVDTFNRICDHCKDYLVEHKQEIKKWDLDMSDLKKFNPIYIKRDLKTGQPAVGASPVLYPKLIISKKNGQENILTLFRDGNTQINPLDVLNKYCNVIAAVKIESIFVGGTRIVLQVKLWEVNVSIQNRGIRSLIQDPVNESARPIHQIEQTSTTKSPPSREGSIVQDDDDNDLDQDIDVRPPRNFRGGKRGSR